MRDPVPENEREFRARAAAALALTALVTAAPFGIVDLVVGNRDSGTATLAIVLALAVHAALAARAPGAARVSAPLLVPVCIVALVLSLERHGTGALFWCFPAVLGYCCLLGERTAWAACAATVLVVLGLAWTRVEPDVVVRAAATLVVVATFAATVVRIISRQNRQLRSRLETDPLTGLMNRQTLDARLARAAAEAHAHDVPMALVALDIDRFKAVNDGFGHAAGDAVLRATGAFLAGAVRAGDDVWRVGGEEFLVLLHGATAEEARHVAAALVLGYPLAVSRPDGRATVSAGLAALESDEGPERWMRRADRALYAAKAAGRDRLVDAARQADAPADGRARTAVGPIADPA